MPPLPKSMTMAEQGEAPPAKNIWIGNLSPDVTEADLQAIFSKHGEIDSITAYAARTYAFVYFRNLDDAKAAKEALQGYLLRGNPIKIEFAKPAKPCKSLWVAGISQSLSKDELEKEFSKFGKIQEFKFHRDRNTAYIDYFRLEDACQALKNMNGKRIGSDQIRVDFLRSQPTRREQWPDTHDLRGQFHTRMVGAPDGRWMPPDAMRNYAEPMLAGSKRHLFQPPGLRKEDGEPSNILWISYPPSVHIDEDMLHNAMILFGEIERIKSFPDRNYSFVEFRSVDEAILAKEGLQGKLFNDPRIMIQYSSSDIGPGKDIGYYPGIKGPRPDIYFNEAPYRQGQVEAFGPPRPLLPNTVPAHLHPRGVRGSDSMVRPLGPQGRYEPVMPASELSDLSAIHNLPESGPHNLIRGSDWRRSSPVPGVLPSPAGPRAPGKSASSGWDVFDGSQLQRESKRSRVDDGISAYDASFPLTKMDESGLGLDGQHGIGPPGNGSASSSLANLQGRGRLSSVDGRVMTGGLGQRHPEDFIWRGVIAKGGSLVCHARCVPLGEGIEFDIPEVVNCSARTGLDLLTKHYADAVGFSIVFFLPDSEEDFASYTEFLRYLGSKNRAGVAKFDDGTTLFLVPPSDFLTKVLNVTGPERLYGVVLKFGQHGPSSTSIQPPSVPPHYGGTRQKTTPQSGYNIMSQEERGLQTDYKIVPHEESKPPLRTPGVPGTDSLAVHSVPPVSTATTPPSGVSLTPELIATLASLLPANSKSSAPETVPLPSGSTTMGPGLAPDKVLTQGWKHENQTPEQAGHLVQPFGSQYNIQAQHVSQVQAYPVDSSASSYSAHGVMSSSQAQDGPFNLHSQGAVLSKPLPAASHWQTGQVAYMQQVDQRYQHAMPQDTMKGQAVPHSTDSFMFGSSIQQPTNSVTLPNQVQGAHVPQQHGSMPLPSETPPAPQNYQFQASQTPHHSAGQMASEGETDKNERYRTTLLFAANLLSKIQQQPPGTQTGQGSGSH